MWHWLWDWLIGGGWKNGKEVVNEGWKNGEQTFSAGWEGSEGKGNPCSVMMEQLPEVTWKVETVFSELVDLVKEIFLDKVLTVSVECFWLLLLRNYKEGWTKEGVSNLLSLKIELFLIPNLSSWQKIFKVKDDFRVKTKSRMPGRSFKTSEIFKTVPGRLLSQLEKKGF